MRGNLRMALSGVRAAKWRSLLTMLGVIIGIVSVVTIVGIGEGVKQQVSTTLSRFGNDLITVRPTNAVLGAQTNPLATVNNDLFGMSTTGGITPQDVHTIAQTQAVHVSAPLGIVTGIPRADEKSMGNGLVIATSSGLPEAINQQVAYGEFWNNSEEDTNFAVIGSRVATDLFGEQVPLGKSFMFRGERFMVRGVFDQFPEIPLSPTASFNKAIFIPYKTAMRITKGSTLFYVVLVKSEDSGLTDDMVASLSTRLKNAHGGQQDVSVLGPKDNLAAGNHILDLLTSWVFAVAVVALLIGGVGLMNIMLVTVTERMHEIGVRKAIGATNRQILSQFVLEATVLSVFGGMVGIIASLGVIGSLRTYTDLKPVVSWEAIATAFLVALGIGVIFGAAPAIKAARKDPIHALRHE